jgi:hypothetical protein
LESRKRSRNDMEIDVDDAAGGVERVLYGGGHLPEDRGSKRYHRRGVEGPEDDRIVP